MAGFQTSFLLCFFILCCCEFIIWKQQLSIKTGLYGIQLDPHHRLCVWMEGTGLYKNISCVLFCCVTLYQRKN